MLYMLILHICHKTSLFFVFFGGEGEERGKWVGGDQNKFFKKG